MREPYDDIDADKVEQILARRQERLLSLTCICGKPKDKGAWLCPACEEEDYREMVRLNPPQNYEDET